MAKRGATGAVAGPELSYLLPGGPAWRLALMMVGDSGMRAAHGSSGSTTELMRRSCLLFASRSARFMARANASSRSHITRCQEDSLSLSLTYRQRGGREDVVA